MTKRHRRKWRHDGDALTQFPDDVLAMTELEELDLSGGFASRKLSIPPAIGALAKLRRLSIGSTPVESLPEALGRLTNLVRLELDYAEALRVLPSSLGKLRALNYLSLSYTRRLRALPTSIGKLAQLETLYASPSGIKAVPATLWACRRLRRLSIPEAVKQLPPGISKLAQLESLSCGPSALASIASELPALTKLKTLTVGFAPAKSIPDEVGSLTSLRELKLFYLKQVTTLPASLANLRKLRKLDVAGNALTELATLVCALPRLEELAYGGNKLPLAERRRLEQLMRLPPKQRQLDVAIASPPATAKPQLLGSVASVNAHLATLLVDGKLAPGWTGIGDDPANLDASDWARFNKTVRNKVAAPIEVGEGTAMAVAMAIGHGFANVYRTGDRLAIVEAFVDDDSDPMFLEYVASEPARPKHVGTLDVPSGALVVTPSTDGLADVPKKRARLGKTGVACGADSSSLLVAVPHRRYDVLVENQVTRSWGSGRRTILRPS